MPGTPRTPRTPGTPASSHTGRPRPGRTRRVLAAVVLAAAVVTAVLALALGRDGSGGGTAAPATVSTPEAQEPTNPELLGLARRDGADPLALGSPDAPVVLIEYSDFQCPFCGRFARETKPHLVHDYVDKGVLRIEWRNFPVFGAESDQAARAGWAAGQQNRFWQFHDTAYAEPRRRNAGDFSEDKLTAMARKAGVEDLARFEKDMASDAAHRAVTRDTEEGYGIGVTSTPAFLINGRPVLGAQPTDVFTDIIDEAAEQARQREDGDE
ncbi:DsbA family protein [Streptomyces fradiae]|uniref:DsbA family protein n=1 Tax=Streptomyces fradiae TaxID=1906 RepID=UPI0029426671|nr:thioredoxin domain-containing protein [Streptomyces fradiae]WOI60405.1 thioredoxin domain-containing protein [Streptomyces fradiae]